MTIAKQNDELFSDFTLNASMDHFATTVARLIALYDLSMEDHVITCASGMSFHI
jgi:hypothetical protein